MHVCENYMHECVGVCVCVSVYTVGCVCRSAVHACVCVRTT